MNIFRQFQYMYFVYHCDETVPDRRIDTIVSYLSSIHISISQPIYKSNVNAWADRNVRRARPRAQLFPIEWKIQKQRWNKSIHSRRVEDEMALDSVDADRFLRNIDANHSNISSNTDN